MSVGFRARHTRRHFVDVDGAGIGGRVGVERPGVWVWQRQIFVDDEIQVRADNARIDDAAVHFDALDERGRVRSATSIVKTWPRISPAGGR